MTKVTVLDTNYDEMTSILTITGEARHEFGLEAVEDMTGTFSVNVNFVNNTTWMTYPRWMGVRYAHRFAGQLLDTWEDRYDDQCDCHRSNHVCINGFVVEFD